MSLRLDRGEGTASARMSVGQVFDSLLGTDTRTRITAYDGSASGPEDATYSMHLSTERGLSYLLTAPGELGLARAYVAGDLTVGGVHPGDPYDFLRHLEDNVELRRPSPRTAVDLIRGVGLRALRPPAPPQQEATPQWRRAVHGLRHSKTRDAEAIHHHYDVSNRFYEWVLGPSMTYTCACYPRLDATLEEAQANKYDLVARKLGLEPGMRLLDVGCGWGGMVRHAAKHYGVKALGVTLSREQAAWAQAAIEREGLSDLAEVRFMDYRDVREGGFDAVSSIGLTEHIGVQELPGVLRVPAGQAASRRAAAQPLHHPAGQPARRDHARRVHRPLRLPGRRADRLRPHHHRRCRTPASRCATRRTCASTTR